MRIIKVENNVAYVDFSKDTTTDEGEVPATPLSECDKLFNENGELMIVLKWHDSINHYFVQMLNNNLTYVEKFGILVRVEDWLIQRKIPETLVATELEILMRTLGSDSEEVCQLRVDMGE